MIRNNLRLMNRLNKSVVALMLVCLSPPGWGADVPVSGDNAEIPSDLAIVVEGGLMSVDLQRKPLNLVLEEVGRQSGITFIIPAFVEEVLVSEQFQGLSLAEGIRRLLKGYNYLLEYESSPMQSAGGKDSPTMSVRVLESKVLDSEEIRAIAKTQPRRKPHEAGTGPEDRITQLRTLAEQKDQAQLMSSLSNFVHDPEQQVREVVLEILRNMEDDAPVELMVEIGLRDPSPELRTAALASLVERQGEAALESLERAMEDSDPNVREQASEWIEQLRTE
jgi:hypothetical protein